MLVLVFGMPTSLSARRAWIEIRYKILSTRSKTSLSARRAWIEIANTCFWKPCLWVALRKESVDRNTLQNFIDPLKNASLSARRAWIEIK